jgi:hypothetical protein
MGKSNNVVIVPGKASSLATALRGHVNATLAYMRLGEEEMMEESIKAMRRDMVSLEREVRFVIKAGE